jgi:hypothetical protein
MGWRGGVRLGKVGVGEFGAGLRENEGVVDGDGILLLIMENGLIVLVFEITVQL